MTDHLTEARACATSASQAPDAGSAISWLTDTCKQIIAHLEAQNMPPQPATAPSAAQQGDSGHGDGGEAADAQGPVTWLTQVFRNAYVEHMTALDHEEGKAPEPEAYKRDFNLWRDHLRAQAWDKGHSAAIEAVGDSVWGEPTTAVNPYRQEQP